jgi:hypothetical protein
MFIASARRGEGTMVEGSASVLRQRGTIIGLDAWLVTTAHGQGLVEIVGFELMSHEG